jgi:hypothetical protein
LLLHHRTREDHPLVLLANRDEYFDRPFEAPRVLDEDHGIVAPRDLRGGGTWFGVNRHGVVAALTNRRGESVDEGVRSRGLLVLDALRHADAEAALAWSRDHLGRTAYAGFHLLVADPRRAFILRHPGSPVASPPAADDVIPLAPGAHVLTNLHEPGEVPVPDGGAPDPAERIEATLARLERVAADDRPHLPGGHRILKRESTPRRPLRASRRRSGRCRVRGPS